MNKTDEDEKNDENQDVKVNDRRRFEPDGTPKTGDTPSEAMGEREENPPSEPGLPADFSSLLLSLAASAQSALGISPHPISGKLEKNLLQAKHAIDLLGILSDKTKGNLTEEEEKLLQALLYNLRIQYVEAGKADHDEKK